MADVVDASQSVAIDLRDRQVIEPAAL